MFRLAVAAVCAQIVAGARVSESEGELQLHELQHAKLDKSQPQRCDAGRTCPSYDHCHPVSYGSYGCGFQCTRRGGHGSYLCNNHCAGCNYVSLLELSPSLLDTSESENVDAADSLAKHQKSGHSLAELSAENEESKEEAVEAVEEMNSDTNAFAARNTITNADIDTRLYAQDWCCSSSDSGWAVGVGATTLHSAPEPDQQWTLVAANNAHGYHYITNVASGRRLFVTNGVVAAKPGTTTHDNAMWHIERSSGTYLITNFQSGCRLYSNQYHPIACRGYVSNPNLYADQKWNIASA